MTYDPPLLFTEGSIVSKIRSLVAASLVLASVGAHATTTQSIQNSGTGLVSGSFAGDDSVSTFVLDFTPYSSLGALTNFSAVLGAISAFGQGYEVTQATFDSTAFTPVVNVPGFDYWTFSTTNLTPTTHTIQVYGTALGGSANGFAGTYGVSASALTLPTSVPEPQGYALLLAGLGLLGATSIRRKSSRD